MADDDVSDQIRAIIEESLNVKKYIDPLARAGMLNPSKLLLIPAESISFQTYVPIDIVKQIIDVVSAKLLPQPSDPHSTTIPPRFDDAILDGTAQLPDGSLVELVGEARSGKSNIAFQIAVNARVADSSRPVVYISTEGKVPTNRIAEIGRGTGADEKLIMDGIAIIEADTVTDLNDVVQDQLPQFFFTPGQRAPSVVIIDSIASSIRIEYDVNSVYDRTKLLFNIATTLKWLAGEGQTLIVVTNQVTANMDLFANTDWSPALGMSWAFCLNIRLVIRRTETKHEIDQSRVVRTSPDSYHDTQVKNVPIRTMTVAISPIKQDARCKFVITPYGLQGI